MVIEKSILAAVVVYTVLAHIALAAKWRLARGPQTVFLFLSAGTTLATIVAADMSNAAHVEYVLYLQCGLAAFVIGTIVTVVGMRFDHRHELREFESRTWQLEIKGRQYAIVLVTTFVCLTVAAIYYVRVGYFVPWEAARQIAAGGDLLAVARVYSELRREAHQTGAYTAPGYVMQFKDWLLSLMVLLIYARMRVRRTLVLRLGFGVIFLACVLGLIGTGRRQGLVFFLGSFLFIGTWRSIAPFTFTRRQTALVSVVLLCVFGALTVMMGREAGGTWGGIIQAPIALLNRAFVVPAKEHLLLLTQFLYTVPTQWGMGWASSLVGVLPGRQTGLANELHALLYGSEYGNVGLNAWGSLWYNFRWMGVVLASGYGAALQYYYIMMLRGRKSDIRVITLSYTGILLGLSEDPYRMLLNGVMTLTLFFVAADIIRRLRGGLHRPFSARGTDAELGTSAGPRNVPDGNVVQGIGVMA